MGLMKRLEDIELNAIGALVDARSCGLAEKKDTLRLTSGQDTTNHVAAEA